MARPRKPEAEKRRRRDVWLSDAEWAEVERRAAAARLPVRQYIRRAALGKRIRAAPSVANLDAWRQLARAVANLNQYQAAINAGQAHGYPPELIGELREQVEALRAELIGVRRTGGDDDGGDTTESEVAS